METPRSYIRFEDGTEEDIVYFEKRFEWRYYIFN